MFVSNQFLDWAAELHFIYLAKKDLQRQLGKLYGIYLVIQMCKLDVQLSFKRVFGAEAAR